MDTRPAAPSEAAACPRCKAALTPESRHCDGCGYTLDGVRLYNPKHFIWLALLFTALVPIYMAASNWGRLGENKKKWQWLGFGFLGLTVLFALLALSPREIPGGRLIGHLINLPVAYLLQTLQRPLFWTAGRLGARPGSLWKGTMVGLVLVAAALGLGIAGPWAAYQIEIRRGNNLIGESKYEEAARIYQDMLRRDPDDGAAEFNLALCNYAMGRWAEAGSGFDRYLRHSSRDPVAYVFLAYVRARQGQRAEADSLAAKARSLDAQVVRRIFGDDEDMASKWEQAMGERP